MILAMALGFAALQTTQDSGKARRVAPAENPANWVTDDDYPAEALRQDQSGTVGFRLLIGSKGEVTGCEVTSSSGSSVLDQASCSLLSARAKFKPALDASGKPIASQFNSRFTWKIPPTLPEAIENWYIAATVQVSEEGVPLSCAPESSGKLGKMGYDPCSAFRLGTPSPFLAEVTGISGKTYTFLAESALVFDGFGAAPDFRYLKPGHRLVALKKTRFEVSESGTVEKCEDLPTGKEGVLAKFPSICGDQRASFAPAQTTDGKPRRVTAMVWTIASVTAE